MGFPRHQVQLVLLMSADGQLPTRLQKMMKIAWSSGLHHPYVLLNHGFKDKDLIASYGPAIQKRLIQIRDEVDPQRAFSVPQPGFHKLDGRTESMLQAPPLAISL